MDVRSRTIFLWLGVGILLIAGIAMLVISFGGSKGKVINDVNAIYTNAALTIVAQQKTMQSGISSATPIPSIFTVPPAMPSLTVDQQTPMLIPTIKPPIVAAITSCDSATYISDVTIPDGTTIPAGESFTKTWRVTNTGTCAWTATYKIVYISGDSLGGKATAIKKVVNPGESADISVILTSSSAFGNNTGTWKLSNDQGVAFGDSLTVIVNSGLGTNTPSPFLTTEAVSTTASTNAPPSETPTVPTIVVQ
jgi:hypothetical protein